MSCLPLIAVLCLLLLSCRREDISVRKEAKELPRRNPAATMLSTAVAIDWPTPAGWLKRRQDAGGMRIASFDVPVSAGDAAEAAVFSFPGDAGGELANVNRWREQLGLSPVDARALQSARTNLKSIAGDVTLFDFTGAQAQSKRLMVGTIRAGGATWFFKLHGPTPSVAAARPAFIGMLEGLRPR